MRAVLKKELNQTIAEPESAKALLSGSDVFFTGREFFRVSKVIADDLLTH